MATWDNPECFWQQCQMAGLLGQGRGIFFLMRERKAVGQSEQSSHAITALSGSEI